MPIEGPGARHARAGTVTRSPARMAPSAHQGSGAISGGATPAPSGQTMMSAARACSTSRLSTGHLPSRGRSHLIDEGTPPGQGRRIVPVDPGHARRPTSRARRSSSSVPSASRIPVGAGRSEKIRAGGAPAPIIRRRATAPGDAGRQDDGGRDNTPPAGGEQSDRRLHQCPPRTRASCWMLPPVLPSEAATLPDARSSLPAGVRERTALEAVAVPLGIGLRRGRSDSH